MAAVTAAAIATVAIGAAAAAQQSKAQRQAAKATEEASEYNARIQQRKADSQARVAKINRRRQLDDKDRYLASVRASQAASGFLTGTGSLLSMYSDIGNRLDERINDYTERALSEEQYTRSKAEMGLFEGEQSAAAQRMAATGTLLSGVSRSAYSGYSMYMNQPRKSN